MLITLGNNIMKVKLTKLFNISILAKEVAKDQQSQGRKVSAQSVAIECLNKLRHKGTNYDKLIHLSGADIKQIRLDVLDLLSTHYPSIAPLIKEQIEYKNRFL